MSEPQPVITAERIGEREGKLFYLGFTLPGRGRERELTAWCKQFGLRVSNRSFYPYLKDTETRFFFPERLYNQHIENFINQGYEISWL